MLPPPATTIILVDGIWNKVNKRIKKFSSSKSSRVPNTHINLFIWTTFITFIITRAVIAEDQENEGKCLCTVEKNGEYCGTELNELNNENSCPKKMFFCGNSNRNKTALLLVDCQPGQECDIKSLLSNVCLKNIQCECPKGLSRGQTYCGDLLNGKHCNPNVTYTCPFLSMIFHPGPVDACPHGCLNGTCIIPETGTNQLGMPL